MLEFELVLPAYNEARSLPSIVERAAAAAAESGYDAERFQLVIVQNGSQDDSAQVLEQLAEGTLGAWFRVVTVPVNQGYGYGLWQGLSTVTASDVGWSHSDMQCDPRDAFAALAKLKESRNPKVVVKGVRSGRNWKDRGVSRVFELFALGLLQMPLYEINAQPKVFPRALLDEIVDPPKTFAFDLYVLYRARQAGYAIETIPVLFPPRIHGVSKWAATFAGRYKTILGMIQYMTELRRAERRT